MHPYLFRVSWLGGWGVPSYGMALLVGFALSLFLALRRKDRPADVTRALLYDVGFWGVVAGIAGARLASVLLQWRDYWPNPDGFGALLLSLVAVWRGGLVFYGGMAGAILSTFLVARRHRASVLEVLDFTAPYLMLGLAVTRIGCFLNGCCFGRPTDLPWGVYFPAGSPVARAWPIPFYDGASAAVHPVQLYAVGGGLLVFGLTVWLYRRRRFGGEALLWVLALYGIDRFALEFFRGDTPGLSLGYPALLRPFGLTVFQTASLLVALAGAALLVWGRVRAARAGAGVPGSGAGAPAGGGPLPEEEAPSRADPTDRPPASAGGSAPAPAFGKKKRRRRRKKKKRKRRG